MSDFHDLQRQSLQELNSTFFDLSPQFGEIKSFPKLGELIYWNHAAISPPSFWVSKQVQTVLDDFASRGSAAFLDVVEQRIQLKVRLARLLGAPSQDGSDFAWCPNTTSGVQAIAHAFPWQHSKGILVFEGEFPTNEIPWRQASIREKVPLFRAGIQALMQADEPDWSEVESFLKQGVQLVAISAVQFQTGFRVPLEALSDLCQAYGAALFVDGIQACGACTLPLDRIDFMASGGHKWMMAVEGAGFLYAHPRWHKRLVPQQAGWLSLAEPLDFLFAGQSVLRHDKPLRCEMSAFEGGAQSALAYAALDASTQILETLGIEKIFQHVQTLLNPLEKALQDREFHSARLLDESRQSCILSVRPPLTDSRDVAQWAAALQQKGITVTTPDGWLRFSPHWPNHLEQVDQIILAIDEVLNISI